MVSTAFRLQRSFSWLILNLAASPTVPGRGEKSGHSTCHLGYTVTSCSQDIASSSMGGPGNWEKIKQLWSGFRKNSRELPQVSCKNGCAGFVFRENAVRGHGKKGLTYQYLMTLISGICEPSWDFVAGWEGMGR